ncbi:LysR substrate-binding domain-containing protein [Salipiger abyssi]|uniref:LysR substrate-binding domain-containing protein n=1 Tax=Salipiger abyssi TaxID=1250539 RepID=UPI0040589766
MSTPRRFLPSVSSLLALEAVERLGTAIAAAEELSLTHSAVSRQLKVLEEQLGVQMFFREGKSLAMTPAGIAYARSVRGYLRNLSQASLQLKARGPKSAVNIATPPAFGAYWLTPRLKRFQDRAPDILINQYTRLAPFDFFQENMDAAIRSGAQDWGNVHSLALSRDRVIPACAPGFAPTLPFPAEALRDQPLLHLETRPGGWEEWFHAQSVETAQLRGMMFDQVTTMARAAAAGMGVALLPDFVAAHEFETGALVPAHDGYSETDGAYSLVWPKTQAPSPPLARLIDWLRSERMAES